MNTVQQFIVTKIGDALSKDDADWLEFLLQPYLHQREIMEDLIKTAVLNHKMSCLGVLLKHALLVAISSAEYTNSILSHPSSNLMRLSTCRGVRTGQTPLHLAAANGYAESLQTWLLYLQTRPDDVQREQFINSEDQEGDRAIGLAAAAGHVQCVELLVRHAQCGLSDGLGRSPVTLAAMRGHADCLGVLLRQEGVCINDSDRDGRTALTYASEFGHDSCVGLLLDASNSQSENAGHPEMNSITSAHQALMYAAEEDHTHCLQLLLDMAPLALSSANEALLRAARNGSVGCIELLIQHEGVDINVDLLGEQTALIQAVRARQIEAVRVLCAHGAHVDARAKLDDRSALMTAARMPNSNALVALLLQRGADINLQDRDGNTALLFATKFKSSSLRTLLSAGANPNLQNKEGHFALSVVECRSFEEVDALLKAGANPNQVDSYGRSPLMMAVRNTCVKCTTSLLLSGANPNAPGPLGLTPLAWLFRGRGKRSGTLVNLLCEAGADVDVADNDGRTPLMTAVIEGGNRGVKRLLQWKANIHLKDHEGRTALFFASQSPNSRGIVRMLVHKGADILSTTRTGEFPVAVANDLTTTYLLLRGAPGSWSAQYPLMKRSYDAKV